MRWTGVGIGGEGKEEVEVGNGMGKGKGWYGVEGRGVVMVAGTRDG